jgi:hypothetical protein
VYVILKIESSLVMFFGDTRSEIQPLCHQKTINMKRIILTDEVTIEGPSFLGNNSRITFTPAGEPGWFMIVRGKNVKHKIPINHKIASCLKGRIQLSFGNVVINTWEHIGMLRFLGIDGVCVEIKYNESWPPYLGGAGSYYELISKHLKLTGDHLPQIKGSTNVLYKYKSGLKRYESYIENGETNILELDVFTEWHPFPIYNRMMVINEITQPFLLENVINSKPQGYPNSRFYLSKFISLFGWPNHNYIAWQKDFETDKDVAYAFWLHRVQDLLGGLSLASHTALPTGLVVSYNGGHEGDLYVVKNSF